MASQVRDVASTAVPGTGDPHCTRLVDAVGFGYFPLALAARLPYAMIVVGVLTLVVASRGSLTLGGLTSAAAGLGAALVGPLIGAAADRFGQRLTLLVAAAANTAALLTIVVVVHSTLPDIAVAAAAVLLGATAPQPGPMSRSRLVTIIGQRIVPTRRPRVLQSTMAYESGADEVVFVLGPVLVGILASLVDPVAPVLAAAALNLVAVTGFALHRTSRAAASRHAATVPDPVRDLFGPGLVVLVVATLGVGTVFGSVLTSLTAVMQTLGNADQAGLVYGLLGLGSAVLALASGRFPAGFSLRARLLVFGAVVLGGTWLLAGAVGVATALGTSMLAPVMAAMVVIGVGIGPFLVAVFSLAADRSPRGRSATVMTMLGSAVTVGQASSSAVTGAIADAASAGAALWLTVGAGALVVLAAWANRLLAPRPGTMVR